MTAPQDSRINIFYLFIYTIFFHYRFSFFFFLKNHLLQMYKIFDLSIRSYRADK